MHIAFLIRALQSGGAERAAVALGGCMAQNGHTVTILSVLPQESFYAVPSGVRVVYLEDEAALSLSGMRKAGALLRRARHLRKALRALHPDILIGMSPYMNAYAVFGAAGTGVRTIGTERANPFILYADRKTTLLRKAAARLCTGFVCQTDRACSFFPRAVRKKAAVIPNAVFDSRIESLPLAPQPDKVIAAVGRLDHNKGFDLLLRAFSIVSREFPAYRLTIYGEGERRAALESLANDLGIADLVSMPGADVDAILHVSRAAVFVLSSRSEGMPNALMEAMAAGVPCVAADCDMGPAELIQDGVNGLLVPTGDVEAMAQAVLRILRDDAFAERLRTNAVRLRQTHHVQTVTGRWLGYCEKLLRQK